MQTLQPASSRDTRDTRDKQLLDKLLREKYEPIAIVGMGFRFPGSNHSPDGFANFLREGRSGAGPIPPDRWDVAGLAADADPNASPRGRIRTQGGGFLEGIDQFDPRFFNIAPKEANYIDPQQRLVLECAWRALEHANIDPHSLKDGDGGAYIGVACVDYTIEVESLRYEDLDGHIGTGTSHSSVAGRLSFFLGLRGPCIALDTACSSSLVATHLAMQGLRRGECSIALAGGVNAVHHPRHHIIFSQANMLARDGRCKTFDERADGYGRSEGCGILVLKRLSDALRDGNEVFALLRGSAIAQDGASAGLTVPSGPAQEMVMRRALDSAMLSPRDVNVIEAHGTGTPLGDPIEMGAVQAVFGAGRPADEPVIVSSVKTNLGHMEAAAGVGGIVKAALQLQHGEIYPHLNFETPSTQIPWDRYAVAIPTSTRAWPPGTRRVMVNSFGFSGIIAAILLEQAPARTASAASGAPADVEPGRASPSTPCLFTLSARSRPALRTLVQQHLDRLPGASESLADLCRAMQIGRAHFAHRIAAVVRSRDELAKFLTATAESLVADAGAEATSRQPPRVAFLCTGQGSQSVGMGRALYASFPAFREALDECDRLFAVPLARSIKAVMFGDEADAATLIQQTAFTQAALFSLEYATAQLWCSFGIEPDALIGHSIGELVAATLAGVFTLADAVRVVAERGRLMQSVTAPGGMLAVSAAPERVAPLLQGLDDVSFAAFNAPSQCVVSGGNASLAIVGAALAEAGVAAKALPVSHAFHSPLMAEVFPAFRAVFEGMTLREPHITLISNVTGEMANVTEVRDPAYWVQHIGAPVRFAAGMQNLARRGRHLFIEVGPAPVLIGLGRASIAEARAQVWAASMHTGDVDATRLFEALAQAYLAGLSIDWAGVQRGRSGARVDLPHHPLDRKRYWLPVAQRHAQWHLEAHGQDPGTHNTHRPGHPLLGLPVPAQPAGVHQFAQRISATQPAYLTGHVVMGQVIFPAAGYVEVILAFMDAVFGETGREIGELQIHEALVLRDDAFTSLRTRARTLDNGDFELRIGSQLESIEGGGGGGGWSGSERHHVTALLREPSSTSMDEMQAQLLAMRCEAGAPDRTQDAQAFYAAYEAIGLSYGAAFRGVQQVQTFGTSLAQGLIDGEASGAELMPPNLLDAALQTVAGLLDSDATYLPVRIEQARLHKKPRGPLTSLVRWTQGRPGADEELQADLLVLEGKRPVFSIRGLTLKRATTAAMTPKRMVHDLRWLKRSLVQGAEAAKPGKPRRIAVRGGEDFVKAVIAADSNNRVVPAHVGSPAALRMLLAGDTGIADVAWFWRGQTELSGLQRLRSECEANYSDLLALAQMLERDFFDRKLRLWLVTRGAQQLTGDALATTDDSLAAASLWGFGAVLQTEAPRLRTTMIDLPQDAAAAIAALVEEWSAGDAGSAENRIAWRDGHRHVQRIVAPRTSAAIGAAAAGVADLPNLRLAIREYGMLSNLHFEAAPQAPPGADEIQVEMHATGINFKDVLNVLGMLQQHAQDTGQAHVPLPLGFEGSGVVSQAGVNSGFAVGDAVVVNHSGCMQRRITVPALAAVKKPASIGFVSAAGIATAYVTAHYALHALAGMREGDTVLIHAAAGGVGQAAVQLARRVGARVFATASPRKWALLRSQGVAQVMNSRTLDFAQDIARITNGRGVDIVLNSLNKDYIPASLGALAEGGRFIELGKVGVWSAEQMHAQRPDVAYHNFDLSEFEPSVLLQLNREILEEVSSEIDAGRLAPVGCTDYSLDEVEEAFSVLSRGANVGKLVLRWQDDVDPSRAAPSTAFAIDAEALYVITGGFGALGELTARTWAQRGARHLVLVSRHPPAAQALAALRERIGREVEVIGLQADVSEVADVDRLREALAGLNRPLGGIVHAAGTLADAPVSGQSWAGIEKALAPKLYGGWLLHRMAAGLPGRPFFIAYSSVAAVVGSAGQSNYAAANAFLDALANWRSAHSLPALSVNWGPFADVGMAARLGAAQARVVEDRGFKFIRPADGLRTLQSLMDEGRRAQAIVGEVDWRRVLAHQTAGQSLYALVATADEAAGTSSFDIAALMLLGRDDRAKQVNALIRTRIAEMLQFDSADDIAPDTPFTELGLDSLVGLELMNSLEAALGVPLPNSAVFDSPTLPLMTEFILEQLEAGGARRDVEPADVALGV